MYTKCIQKPEGRMQRQNQALLSGAQHRTGGDGHKLKDRRFPLNIGRHVCTVRLTEHWHRLPMELFESPSLEILKSCLHMVLGNRPDLGGWTR